MTMWISAPPNINLLWAGLLLEELRRGGLEHVVISPGSRSAPLTVAAARTPGLRTHLHFDERGAAFFALGLARAKVRPVALICSSGSAVANYLPALVEAAASNIPLLVLTADRPPELLQTGANQAIEQPGIFGRYVRWDATLPCPTTEIPARFVLTTAAQAMHQCRRAPAGPVHLDCMFREPLAPKATGESFDHYLSDLGAWGAGDAPFTKYYAPRAFMDSEQQREVVNHAHYAKLGVLIIGQLDDPLEIHAACVLAEAMPWPVFADVLSGARTNDLAAHYDALLLSPAFRARFTPDTVFHIGGAITSKRLNEFLAERRPKYVYVAAHGDRKDPAHGVTHRVECDLASFSGWLTTWVRGRGDRALLEPLFALSRLAAAAIDAWLDGQATLTEMHVARLVTRHAPAGAIVFAGNSMPVRDLDQFAAADTAAERIVANRGASGIDGNLATALGAAVSLSRPLAVVVGDLTALHDINSIALLREATAPVVIIVINNDGGGIFSFLPIHTHAPGEFEAFFGTPHGLGFEGAAQQFGLEYFAPASPQEFAEQYTAAFARGGATLLEVRTHRDENVQMHRALQAQLTETIDAAIAASQG